MNMSANTKINKKINQSVNKLSNHSSNSWSLFKLRGKSGALKRPLPIGFFKTWEGKRGTTEHEINYTRSVSTRAWLIDGGCICNNSPIDLQVQGLGFLIRPYRRCSFDQNVHHTFVVRTAFSYPRDMIVKHRAMFLACSYMHGYVRTRLMSIRCCLQLLLAWYMGVDHLLVSAHYCGSSGWRFHWVYPIFSYLTSPIVSYVPYVSYVSSYKMNNLFFPFGDLFQTWSFLPTSPQVYFNLFLHIWKMTLSMHLSFDFSHRTRVRFSFVAQFCIYKLSTNSCRRSDLY